MQRSLSFSGTDKAGPGPGSVSQSGSISGSGTGMEMRLIQEHMDRGSLFDALMEGIFSSPESDIGQVNYSALLETAADVARAMIHVHSLNILHNDIKARNVLLKSNDRDPRGVTCKLGDFVSPLNQVMMITS
jgi:serine/threonine protein kinase